MYEDTFTTPVKRQVEPRRHSQPTISDWDRAPGRSGTSGRAHTRRKRLTCRRRKFVSEYVRTLDGPHAATHAGCKARNPRLAASRLLRMAQVQREIHKQLQKREEDYELNGRRILCELSAIAFADVRNFFDKNGWPIPIHMLDERVAKAILAYSVKPLYRGRGRNRRCIGQKLEVRLQDKGKALELLARYLGMF